MIEERAILAALERIARMQDSIRSGMDICRDTGLVFLRVYYEQLPPNVARRLTELHAEDVAEIPRATSTEGNKCQDFHGDDDYILVVGIYRD